MYVREAETDLGQLLDLIEQGEEIIIARNGQAFARLMKFKPKGKREFGAWKGLIRDDSIAWDEPLPPEEIALWEGR